MSGALPTFPSTAYSTVVQWIDTDASGHYHNSAVLRWVEAAEAELYERFDLTGLLGRIPRVGYRVEFLSPLRFRERVRVEFAVAELGRSSIRFDFVVRASSDDRLAARGDLTAVHVNEPGGRAAPWPADIIDKLGPERPGVDRPKE